MTKQSYTPETKADVTRLVFTDINITTEQICRETGIHSRTLSQWKSIALASIPDYLQTVFGDDENISSDARAEVTSDFLRYDCDIEELVDEYGVSADQIKLWASSVLDNLKNVFVSKRKVSSSPIKSKRPNRKVGRTKVVDISSLVSQSSKTDELLKEEM